MAAQLHNDVYDNGLSHLTTSVDELHILSQDPGVATYANIASYTLGNKSSPTISSPEDHTTGRKVTVSAISDGTATGTGTATHFALVDSVNSEILATQELDSGEEVASGDTFTLTELYVAFPAPVT